MFASQNHREFKLSEGKEKTGIFVGKGEHLKTTGMKCTKVIIACGVSFQTCNLSLAVRRPF